MDNYKSLNNIAGDDMMTVAINGANKIFNTLKEQPNGYDYSSLFADSYLLKIISIL